MKLKFFLLLLTFNLSCSKSEPKKEPTKEQTDIITQDDVSEYINQSAERVTLLALARAIPIDTLNLILRDYYTANWNRDLNSKECDLTISAISKRYNFSKSNIASLIYNFEYEMLTKDEIYEQQAAYR